MKDVTYRGTAHRARIREEDWKAVGVSSKEVTWEGYGDTQSVANEAAEHLAAKDARFEVEDAEDSAYERRLARDTSERTNRTRVGTRGGITPTAGGASADDSGAGTTGGATPTGTASADDS